VFNENDFNPTSLNPGPRDFALSGARGDEVWLVRTDEDGNILEFVDDVRFGSAATGESFGRGPDGHGPLVPLSATTLGRANLAPRVGPVIVSEINYNPGEPSAAAKAIDPTITRDDLEFIFQPQRPRQRAPPGGISSPLQHRRQR
jgi:hypothetical protein